VLLFGAIAGVGGAITFLPVLLEHGIGYLDFADQPFSTFIGHLPYGMTLGIWGVIGLAAGLYALVSFAVAPKRALANSLLPAHGPTIAAALAAIGLYLAAFLRLPAEAAYLIPAIPFVLLLTAFTLRRRFFVAVCAALCLSPFVFHTVTDPRGITAAGSHRGHSEWRGAGSLFCVHHERALQIKCIRRVFALVETFKAPKIVVNAGTYFVYLTTLADPEMAARMDVARSTQDPAGLYLRGYDNKIMLAYTPQGIAFMLAVGENRKLIDLQPSPLEQALMMTTVDSSAADRFYELLAQTTFYVPAEKVPVRVSYKNSIGIPFYENPARIAILPAHLRGFASRTVTFRDLLNERAPDEVVILNLGFVTERIFQPDEIAMLASFYN
jgi:hypothetical protein